MKDQGILKNQCGMSLVSTIMAMGLSTLMISAIVSASNIQVKQIRTIHAISDMDEKTRVVRDGLSNPANCLFSFQGVSIDTTVTGDPQQDQQFDQDLSQLTFGREDVNNPGQFDAVFVKPRADTDKKRNALLNEVDQISLKIDRVLDLTENRVAGQVRIIENASDLSGVAIRYRDINIEFDLDNSNIVEVCTTSSRGLQAPVTAGAVQGVVFSVRFAPTAVATGGSKWCRAKIVMNDINGNFVPQIPNIPIYGIPTTMDSTCTGNSCPQIANSGRDIWDHCRGAMDAIVTYSLDQLMLAYGLSFNNVLYSNLEMQNVAGLPFWSTGYIREYTYRVIYN